MRRAGARSTTGMLAGVFSEKLRPVIEPFTTGAGRTLARAHLSPNMLTTIGLVATVLCAWLIVLGHTFLAGILLIPTVTIDVLDGALARATGRVTAWGGFYDSVADRIADAVLLVAIAWRARYGDGGLLAAALATIVFSALVPYARAKAEALGYQVGSGPGERAERVVILIAGLILGYVQIGLWAIVGLTAWTFVARCMSVWRQATKS